MVNSINNKAEGIEMKLRPRSSYQQALLHLILYYIYLIGSYYIPKFKCHY